MPIIKYNSPVEEIVLPEAGQVLVAAGQETVAYQDVNNYSIYISDLFNTSYNVFKIVGQFSDAIDQGQMFLFFLNLVGGRMYPSGIKYFSRTTYGIDNITDPPVTSSGNIQTSNADAIIESAPDATFEMIVSNPTSSTKGKSIYYKMVYPEGGLIGQVETFITIPADLSNAFYGLGFYVSNSEPDYFQKIKYTCFAYKQDTYPV